jgi:hypothetical protein
VFSREIRVGSISGRPWPHMSDEMAVDAQTSYYLPTGYQVERNRGSLVLRRPDGSLMDTFDGQRAIGEIVERYAWEDSVGEGKDGKVGSAYERFLELPVPAVLGLLWLTGTVPIGLCAVALYSLWLLLRTAAGG